MKEIMINPLFYILIVNMVGLVWAVRSWKKNIREKWMNNLRDAGSELIGAAEEIYLKKIINKSSELEGPMSNFIAKEQKILLLFAEDSETQKGFKDQAELIRQAADKADVESYQIEKKKFSSLVAQRLMAEWKDIKGIF